MSGCISRFAVLRRRGVAITGFQLLDSASGSQWNFEACAVSGKLKGTRLDHRNEIAKRSGTIVKTDPFLGCAYAHISAVAYSASDRVNHPSEPSVVFAIILYSDSFSWNARLRRDNRDSARLRFRTPHLTFPPRA